VRKYFPLLDYDSLPFEEKVKARIDAVYLDQRSRLDIAELIAKVLGG
jgi:hypothetical protein